MAQAADIPAWIALFTGLYALAAAIGELREPGMWGSMLEHFETQTGLRYLTGIVCIALGAAIYLSSPWNPADWLSVVVTFIGGGAVVEGVLFLAAGREFMGFSRKLMGAVGRGWALFAGALGLAFIIVALARL